MRMTFKLSIAAAFLAMCLSCVLCGCSMSMGKTTEYQADGKTVWKVEETRKNASTIQMILTIVGMRVKMIAPAGSDMSPVELDFGLIRAAENIVPMGEKASIATEAEGIFPWSGNMLKHSMTVNIDPSTRVDSGVATDTGRK